MTYATLRVDQRRVRHTGRWLVRHGTDRNAALIGLALLATDRAEHDIRLLQTIGLLSDTFVPLAATALRRRRGGAQALLWLAQRVADWGFAGQVATAAHPHEAITGDDVDDDLVDHTGRLLRVMTDCQGTGMTLEHYPPAPVVLAAHVGHLGRQVPTANRYLDAAVIAERMAAKPPEQCGCTAAQRDEIVLRLRAVLNRQEWSDTATG